MKLEIIRKEKEFTDISTIGDFIIDGKFFSYSLEDKERQTQPDGAVRSWSPDLKIKGETAIPYGVYEVITNYSTRFKKVMPLLLNVPSFEGVRIHNGSFAGDTEGCPLIGYIKAKDFIGQSRKAFNDFMPKLVAGLTEGRVFLTIKREVRNEEANSNLDNSTGSDVGRNGITA